eukprot:COSAG06_NODE_16787_length_981_cov_0.655329_1_plen_83_part_00
MILRLGRQAAGVSKLEKVNTDGQCEQITKDVFAVAVTPLLCAACYAPLRSLLCSSAGALIRQASDQPCLRSNWLVSALPVLD